MTKPGKDKDGAVVTVKKHVLSQEWCKWEWYFLYYSVGTIHTKGTGILSKLKMILELIGGEGSTEAWIRGEMGQYPFYYKSQWTNCQVFSKAPTNPEILNFRLEWDCPFWKATKTLHLSSTCFVTTAPLLVRGRRRTCHFRELHNSILLYLKAFLTCHIKTHLCSSEVIFVDRDAMWRREGRRTDLRGAGALFLSLSRAPITDTEWLSPIIFQLKLLVVLEITER